MPDRRSAVFVMLASSVLLFATTALGGIVDYRIGSWLLHKLTWLRQGERSAKSSSPWALVAAAIVGVGISLVMLYLRVGITVPVPGPTYPMRL
jgi:hypothetical protein